MFEPMNNSFFGNEIGSRGKNTTLKWISIFIKS